MRLNQSDWDKRRDENMRWKQVFYVFDEIRVQDYSKVQTMLDSLRNIHDNGELIRHSSDDFERSGDVTSRS